MKLCCLPGLLALLLVASAAQAAPGVPQAAPERQVFALGVALSRACFAYAPLAKQAAGIEKTRSKTEQVRQLSRLDPVAGQNRARAREQMDRALALMRGLHAPDAALAPVAAAAARLAGPLPLTDDARYLAFFSRPAARTVASLAEFQILSSLPEDPAVRRWLQALPPARAAERWYSAGTLAGVSEIAAAHDMPDLLPPPAQVFSVLRALPARPAAPALQSEVDAFLRAAPSPRFAAPQVQALGRISRRLQSEVLGAEAESAEVPAGPI